MYDEAQIRSAFIDRFVLDEPVAVEVRMESRGGRRVLVAVVDEASSLSKLPEHFGSLSVVGELDSPVFAALA
ncbi:MAG TPA: hypothetical protein VF533_19865 [Solirubrobacteraceae bacterium]|jgi:hypothetical protein